MKGGGMGFLDKLAAGISFKAPVSTPRGDHLRVYRHRLSKALLLGVERGISYAMSESLAQPGGNESMEVPLKTQIKIPAGFCYDLRTGKMLGRDQISIEIDPWRPTLLAIMEKETANVMELLLK